MCFPCGLIVCHHSLSATFWWAFFDRWWPLASACLSMTNLNNFSFIWYLMCLNPAPDFSPFSTTSAACGGAFDKLSVKSFSQTLLAGSGFVVFLPFRHHLWSIFYCYPLFGWLVIFYLAGFLFFIRLDYFSLFEVDPWQLWNLCICFHQLSHCLTIY